MVAAGVAFNGIVSELLTDDNYERWSVLVKNYLIGQDLWNVVSCRADRDNTEWQKKNAKALHIIQLSCGPYAFHEAQRCEIAKVAWNQLSLLFSTYKKADQDIEQGMPQDSFIEEEKKLHPKIIDAIRNRGLDVLDDIYVLIGCDMTKVSHTDQFGNNILHMAAKSRPSSSDGRSSCAALQMQTELQFFKKVERMVNPKCKEQKNVQEKKPHEIFSESHKELAEAGERWARRSAASFSLVGTLIITMMFAAVFTVPGGYNQETGVPIFLNRKWLKVFIIADAMSLFLSTASVLIFVGILSSLHSETDFLVTLPSKLVTGVFILFLSVVSMVVSFGAALFLMLSGETKIVFIAIVFACLPIAVFVTIQLPLFKEFLISSVTYDRAKFLLKYAKYKIKRYFGLKHHQLEDVLRSSEAERCV